MVDNTKSKKKSKRKSNKILKIKKDNINEEKSKKETDKKESDEEKKLCGGKTDEKETDEEKNNKDIKNTYITRQINQKNRPINQKTRQINQKNRPIKEKNNKKIKDKILKEKSINPCNWIYMDNINSNILCNKAEQIYKKNLQNKYITQEDKNKMIDESKKYILQVCEAPIDKYEVYFTSGDIESNNIILCAAINAYKKIRKIKPHIIISTVEDDSIVTYAKSLFDSDQIDLSIIKSNSYGCILSETILEAIKPNTCFVSITYINSEMGSVNNIEKISSILHAKKIPLHCDCTNIFGKHKLDLSKTNIDTATITFDKINGPIGIGALIINNNLLNGYKLYEHSTTLAGKRIQNIPAIASAIESLKVSLINRKNKNKKILKFRNDIISKIGEKCQIMTFANFMKSDAPPLLDESKKSTNKLIILGPPANNESYYTPSILSLMIISDKKKTGDNIKKELEKMGIIIGVHDINKNFMYKEIGIPKDAINYIIRLSLSDDLTQDDVNKFINAIKSII